MCYWIVRPTKPGVHSSDYNQVRFTVTSHIHRFLLYHPHTFYNRNWNYLCLVNFIQICALLLSFVICSTTLMNLSETFHLKDSTCWLVSLPVYAAMIVIAREDIMMPHGLNTYCDVTAPPNNGTCVIIHFINLHYMYASERMIIRVRDLGRYRFK